MSYQSVLELKALAQRKPTKVTVGETDMVLIRDGDRVQALQAKMSARGRRRWSRAQCAGDKTGVSVA